jgi:hypothetical protein
MKKGEEEEGRGGEKKKKGNRRGDVGRSGTENMNLKKGIGE